MPNFISLIERKVNAKGLNKSPPNEDKLREYFFDDDYQNLKFLKEIPKIKLTKKVPALFYPGCGADILFPLKYIEVIFPEIEEINFIFNDKENSLGLIKTILDDIGIGFSENDSNMDNVGNVNNVNNVSFYWKHLLVNLKFTTGNIFNLLSTLPAFDIYFERAFRIMKDDYPSYEQEVYNKLNTEGILISDSGFQEQKLKLIKVPKILSSYGEMIVGVKE
ncbi:MAG: hypothetical protein ABH824_03395 [Nanoarchaeota archaeon]